MKVPVWIAALVLSAGSARADHVHTMEHHGEGGGNAFGAGLTMLAASFDTMLYGGNYQGILPAFQWSNERFGAGVSAALYRIEENGALHYGPGDVVAHGQVAILQTRRASAGVIAAVSAPTGDERYGLGMGHPMAMPALFGMVGIDRVALTATAGYSRAIAGIGGHNHGMWPIVEPMNLQELTWSAAGDVAITPAVHGAARFSGGIPIGNGDNRIVGALRASWATGRVTTAAELQAGLAGDPFNLRGVVSTALSF